MLVGTLTVAVALLVLATRPGSPGAFLGGGVPGGSPSVDPGAIAAAANAQAGLARQADPHSDRFDLDARLPAPPATLTGYRWPLSNARITQGFGASTGALFIVGGVAFHDGIDIANYCGAPIVAAHDGVVIAAGRRTDEAMGWVGNLAAYLARLQAKNLWSALAIAVVIDDGNGYQSVYLHFERIVVKVGQAVRAGDLLGLEGATGHATGCHLHYSLFSPDSPDRFETDPVAVRLRLLPAAEIARIDPILVLPPLATAGITWGWGAQDAP
jgi:murein DD-endopeptidase MepM/ murein hydrolase activator NlpD